MFKKALAALLAASALTGVNALAADGGLSPFIGGGLTIGGENMAEAQYTNGNSYTIKSGSLVDLRAGVDYRLPGTSFSIQGAVAYHVDRAAADNGDVTFSRVPVEVLVHWHENEQWSIGWGLRKATGAKLDSSGAGSNFAPDVEFKSSLGLIVEGEYKFTPNFGLKARYVKEEYKSKDGYETKFEGSHFGLLGVYYFR